MRTLYEMSYEDNQFCYVVTCETNEQLLTKIENLYKTNNELFKREKFGNIIGHRFLSDNCVNIPEIKFVP